MRIFRDMDLVEQLGSGVPRILQSYGEECFKFSDNFIRMSFPIEKQVGETVGETLGETGQKIISLLKKQPSITQKEIAGKLNMSVRGVEYNLSKLKELGLIRREGEIKKGIWIVL